MLFFIGVVIVVVSVLGAYQVHGDLKVLWQPLEIIIIVGAATGAFIISNMTTVMKDSIKCLKWLLKGTPYKKKHYLELLKFLFEFFKIMKTEGMLKIESHIENPHESSLFAKYPTIQSDHHITDFFCDNIRLLTLGVDNQYILSDTIEREIEIHHHELESASTALKTYGESLPALGIVAAVLGVIVTMRSISEPPEILGGLIGAALVGTFMGILLSYGVFSPIGSFASQYAAALTDYLNCIKIAIISQVQGNAPIVTIELVRKSIPSHHRPSFKEVEEAIKS